MISVKELNIVLLAILGDERLIDMWWDSENGAFNYETPREVYATHPNKVINYIMSHYQK